MQPTRWTWKGVDLPAELTHAVGLRFEADLLEAYLAPIEWGTGHQTNGHQTRGHQTADHQTAGEPSEDQDVSEELFNASGELALLSELAGLYGELGQLQKGLEVDQTLVRLFPGEPVYHYNLACRYSRLGQVEQGLESLEEAISLGYHNFERLRGDPDLDNLKTDPRFELLLDRFEVEF